AVTTKPLALDELERVLAVVPDVPLVVLRVVVRRLLRGFAVGEARVVHDDAGHSLDDPGLTRDHGRRGGLLPIAGPLVVQHRPGWQGKVRVVDDRREPGGG